MSTSDTKPAKKALTEAIEELRRRPPAAGTPETTGTNHPYVEVTDSRGHEGAAA